MSRNSTALCSHDNPDYVEHPRSEESDHWSGCAIPSDDSLAPIVGQCCTSLGDGFQLTYQHWFQLVAETETDSVSCYTTCLTNTSSVLYADSQNITDCVGAAASDQQLDSSSALRCGGPPMRTSGGVTLHPGGDSLAWTAGILALVACLARL